MFVLRAHSAGLRLRHRPHAVVCNGWSVPPAVGRGDLPTCRWRGGLRTEASLRHPWLRIPLGLSLPSRQIGAGIINPVQTPIWPLTILRLGVCRLSGRPRAPGFSSPAGATRHPWRDAPFCGHPDRAPATFTPPPGPTDGAGFCVSCLKQSLPAWCWLG